VPKFRFSAAASDGTVVTGIESSTAINELRDALLDRNLQPISILEKKSILQFEITKKKVGKRDLMHLGRLCLGGPGRAVRGDEQQAAQVGP
jgi:type II secretory pathway component PulF